MVATVTQQIGDEMAEAVEMDPLVAVALIQALMQVLVMVCRREPLTPEKRMLHLANHHPRRLKNHIRRRGRRLKMSEAEIDRVQAWMPERIKRSSLEVRWALCSEATNAAVSA